MKIISRVICATFIFFLVGQCQAQSIDTLAEKMMLYQRSVGGWPKAVHGKAINYKTPLTKAAQSTIQADSLRDDSTIDNNATSREIIHLVRAFTKTGNNKYLTAAEKGIEYLLTAQYKNGGWPQYYPRKDLYRHQITYNDNAMVNVLNILLDVAEGTNGFDVINPTYRERATVAVQKGIDCILKTQLTVNGKLTAWCTQYDEKTLKPETARAYELPSLSSSESVNIVRFLMRAKRPSTEIKRAINAAVVWFETVKIIGYDFVYVKNTALPDGKDRVLVKNPSSVLWARFYQINTNEPMFAGRNGQVKKSVAEIEVERRTGYAWYGSWPQKLLSTDFPEWKKYN